MEQVTEDGEADGYFSDSRFASWRSHGKVQGAGRLMDVNQENAIGDDAEMQEECPKLATGAWSSGSITWTIPCVWREPAGFAVSKGLVPYATKEQRFLIDPQGTVTVEKFNCSATRDIQGNTSTSHGN